MAPMGESSPLPGEYADGLGESGGDGPNLVHNRENPGPHWENPAHYQENMRMEWENPAGMDRIRFIIERILGPNGRIQPIIGRICGWIGRFEWGWTDYGAESKIHPLIGRYSKQRKAYR